MIREKDKLTAILNNYSISDVFEFIIEYLGKNHKEKLEEDNEGYLILQNDKKHPYTYLKGSGGDVKSLLECYFNSVEGTIMFQQYLAKAASK
jgi:hypothetical protein